MIDSNKPKFHLVMALIGAVFLVALIFMAQNPKATDSIYFLIGGAGLLFLMGVTSFIRLTVKSSIIRSAILAAAGFIALVVSLIFYNHPEFVSLSFYFVIALQYCYGYRHLYDNKNETEE